MQTKKTDINVIKPENQLSLFGYDDYFDLWIRLLNTQKFPNCILLTGPKGLGKATFAYHFVNSNLGFIAGAYKEGDYWWNQVHKLTIDWTANSVTNENLQCLNCPSNLLLSVLGEVGSGFKYPVSSLYFIDETHGWAITGHGSG